MRPQPLLLAALALAACQKPTDPPTTSAPAAATPTDSARLLPAPTDTSKASATPLPGSPTVPEVSSTNTPTPRAEAAFTFQTPDEWTAQRMTAPQTIYVLRPQNGSRANIVLAETPATVRSLDEVEMGVLAELARMREFEGFTMVEKGRVEAAGQPAFRMHLRGTIEGKAIETVTYSWLQASGHPMQATLTVPTDAVPFGAANATFERVVASLRFAGR